MKKLCFLAFAFLSSGCSVHEAWNGDRKPGLSYVSIDKSGNVSSNNKGAALAQEAFEKLLKDGTKEDLVEFLENHERSTLFIWSAEYNGAMINGSGSTCMQAASYARSTTTTVDVSSSLITAFTNINLKGNETDKLLALHIAEAISNLTETSKQSTYLSAGLFGLCLLHANGGLSEEKLIEAVVKIVEASSLTNKNEKEVADNSLSKIEEKDVQ